MKQKFNYLQNEAAVKEMLKHKWIESQKAGRDIGFATAAVDWIKKYGNEWQRIHGISDDTYHEQLSGLAERRKYRRVKINLPIKIQLGGSELNTHIKDFNHIGMDFFSDVSLPVESPIEIITPSKPNQKNKLLNFHLRAKVIKNIPYKNPRNQNNRYLIFTRFDKSTQQKIIDDKSNLFN